METTRSCSVCKSTMASAKVEHPYWHESELIALVQQVPSWVCQLCGHRYFESQVKRRMETLVQDYIRLGQTFPIPSTLYKETMEAVARD